MPQNLTIQRGDLSRHTIAPGHQRVAAIDIGSNSIRQIVADVSNDGAMQVVDEMKAAPRLAAGLHASGALADTSIRAAVEAVDRMATVARQLGAERIEAAATSAVRDTSNAAEFLAAVNKACGLKVRVLDGEEEARLSFRSAVAHFDMRTGRTVVIDIGGGSLELALSAEGLVEHLISLPFGAIRLTEDFLADGSSPERVRGLRCTVRDGLREQMSRRDWRGAQLIGSGGTFTNLARMYLARQNSPTARSVHGARVPRSDLERILDALDGMRPEELRKVPGLDPERADIIVAGIAVAAEVLRRIKGCDVIVSRYGIREGLLLEAARVVPTIADPGDARARSIAEFARRCHVEQPHSSHVQRLALALFDSIGERLGLAAQDRQTLADAALLHDCGYHISFDRHHKHSYHLILHADLRGLSPLEQVVIASVARYHRGSPPRKEHRNFAALDSRLRRRVRCLSALLRVADGLDRGHVCAVSDIKVRWVRRALRISAVPATASTPIQVELWGASRKSELLASVAGIPVEMVAPDGHVLASGHVAPDAGG